MRFLRHVSVAYDNDDSRLEDVTPTVDAITVSSSDDSIENDTPMTQGLQDSSMKLKSKLVSEH